MCLYVIMLTPSPIRVPVDGGWPRLKLPRSTGDNRVLTYVNRFSAALNRVQPRCNRNNRNSTGERFLGRPKNLPINRAQPCLSGSTATLPWSTGVYRYLTGMYRIYTTVLRIYYFIPLDCGRDTVAPGWVTVHPGWLTVHRVRDTVHPVWHRQTAVEIR